MVSDKDVKTSFIFDKITLNNQEINIKKYDIRITDQIERIEEKKKATKIEYALLTDSDTINNYSEKIKTYVSYLNIKQLDNNMKDEKKKEFLNNICSKVYGKNNASIKFCRFYFMFYRKTLIIKFDDLNKVYKNFLENIERKWNEIVSSDNKEKNFKRLDEFHFISDKKAVINFTVFDRKNKYKYKKERIQVYMGNHDNKEEIYFEKVVEN